MVRKRQQNLEELDISPSVVPETGITLLKKQIEKAENMLKNRPIVTSDHTAWANTTRDYLIKTFGNKSKNIDAVLHASSSKQLYMGMDDSDYEQYEASRMENQIKMLESCIEQLETNIELSRGQTGLPDADKRCEVSERVFIVHGLDLGTKETIARIIGQLGLSPIILHEQPNMGRTLIEKFTDYSDVGFAVVLLTADDLGRAKSEDTLAARARQNVIFELGYFLGKLGRQRVCALYETGVQLPSDYSGIAYVELDIAGKWKYDLVRELKAAGYNVDANKLF